MGSRANLVLVKGDRTDVFYSHWCAQVLDRELFFGPLHAEHFISAQKKIDVASGLLQEGWAEGGVALDTNRRYLVWYGGETARFNLSYRQLNLELMREVWSGWSVEWAQNGMADIADYAGVPRANVYRARPNDLKFKVVPIAGPTVVDVVASVCRENGQLTIHGLLNADPFDCLATGPKILELLLADVGADQLTVRTRFDGQPWIPAGGFHVDMTRRELFGWQRGDRADPFNRLYPLWAGWDFRWEQDRFESHLAVCQGRLQIPLPEMGDLLEELEETLTQRPRSGAAVALDMINSLSNAGYEIGVNPRILDDVQVELSDQERVSVFKSALQTWIARKPTQPSTRFHC